MNFNVLPEDDEPVNCRPEINDGNVEDTMLDSILFYTFTVIMLCGIVFIATYAFFTL